MVLSGMQCHLYRSNHVSVSVSVSACGCIRAEVVELGGLGLDRIRLI